MNSIVQILFMLEEIWGLVGFSEGWIHAQARRVVEGWEAGKEVKLCAGELSPIPRRKNSSLLLLHLKSWLIVSEELGEGVREV